MNRYMTFTREQFLKRKDIKERKFLISVNYSVIKCNKGSCCEPITGCVNIYLYGCVSLLVPECAVCVPVFLCVISNQGTSKKPHYLSDLCKLNTFLHKTHIKLFLVLKYQPRLDMCRSILTLSKIAHQMWHDHPFSQRNRTLKRLVGVGLEVTGKWEEVGKILEKGWR